MKLSIIIPAYNESEGIDQTAHNLRSVADKLSNTYELDVLFVDDGSKDHTGDLLRDAFAGDAYVRVISHDGNKGLGAALRTGFKNVEGDIVVTTDFDGTYDFATIPDIVAMLESSAVDIVTASPYHPLGAVEGVSEFRLLFSKGASLLYRILVNPRIFTWTALFRAYRKPVIKSVAFESNDFLAGTELLVYAIQQGYTVREFPTVLHSRVFGQSSIKVARVTKAHLKFQWKLVNKSLSAKRIIRSVFVSVSVIGLIAIAPRAIRRIFGTS